MTRIPRDPFHEIEPTDAARRYLDTLVPLRAGLYLDPDVALPWNCEPDRCRPLMGRNLCCRVQKRCENLGDDELCAIQAIKPFGCLLFPLELLRIGSARAVVSAGNPLLYPPEWTRFDRDMLQCFIGIEGGPPLFETMLPLIHRVFTRAECAVLEDGYRKLTGG